MGEKHARDARFFISRVNCSNEYTDVNAVLIEIRTSRLRYLYNTYAKLFARVPFKDDALSYFIFMDSCAEFVELDHDGLPNMAGLQPFIDWDEGIVEVPRDTFDMLDKRTASNKVRTDCNVISVCDGSVHWEALDHHGNDSYETDALYWTDLGLKRKKTAI